jgi:hypothetical protein
MSVIEFAGMRKIDDVMAGQFEATALTNHGA